MYFLSRNGECPPMKSLLLSLSCHTPTSTPLRESQVLAVYTILSRSKRVLRPTFFCMCDELFTAAVSRMYWYIRILMTHAVGFHRQGDHYRPFVQTGHIFGYLLRDADLLLLFVYLPLRMTDVTSHSSRLWMWKSPQRSAVSSVPFISFFVCQRWLFRYDKVLVLSPSSVY